MIDIVSGKKKAAPEAKAIKDPESGDLVVSNSGIKEVTLQYCLNTLKNNEPKERVKELIELKEEVHALRMTDQSKDTAYELTDEDNFFIMWKFKSKNSATYQFITKAGHNFQLAIINLCKRIIKNETIQKRFYLTTLIQLPKKGSAQELDNKRFIHMKEWLARLVEALAVHPMKEDIFAPGTKFQIGGCPGKRTAFHIFIIKSKISLKLLMGEGVILTLLDLVKFFDNKSLIDTCDALYKTKVNLKFYRVWFNLNAKTEIEVRTGSGVSDRGLAGPVTGQGGGGAALASALNLDLGIDSYFSGSVDEDCYGKIRLQPLTYIDDVNRSSPDLNSVSAGNIKFSSLAAEKQSKYHPKKSCNLVYGPDS